MENTGSSPPPISPAYRPPSGAVNHVVHVRAKPGGLWAALGFIIGLMLFAGAFFAGIMLGAIGSAAASAGPLVFEQVWRDPAGAGRNRVAIITVEGAIGDDQAEYVRNAVDHVLNDDRYRAVVLRVDSPGGAVAPSDQIWNEMRRLKRRAIPVVASYGGFAASGGYYISCGADYIFAEETTITGSIGVIAQVFTMKGLMDKVGIEPVTIVASGSPQKSVANDIFRQWDERDQETILTMLDAAYATFNTRVRDGRAHVITDVARLDRIADGSIYTARQAKENGLIDSIGYIEDAIAHAESIAGLTPGRSRVMKLRAPGGLMSVLFAESGFGGMLAPTMNADALRETVSDLGRPRVMYLMW